MHQNYCLVSLFEWMHDKTQYVFRLWFIAILNRINANTDILHLFISTCHVASYIFFFILDRHLYIQCMHCNSTVSSIFNGTRVFRSCGSTIEYEPYCHAPLFASRTDETLVDRWQRMERCEPNFARLTIENIYDSMWTLYLLVPAVPVNRNQASQADSLSFFPL